MFEKGDKVRIIKNFLRPNCLGYTLTIDSFRQKTKNMVYYNAIDKYGMPCIVAEKCIEKVDN